ncbi:MAG TPA: hypothetical protein VHX99_00240, partial [Rhizomicrobium sp.]|nr:hypothetical protein [Rhizomicrobium sp.]
MTDHAIALYGNRPRRRPNDQRRVLLQRLISWALVVLVHVALIAALVLDQLHWRTLMMKPAAETMLDLTRLNQSEAEAPPVVLVRPIVPRAAPPEVTTAPVIVVPPPNIQPLAPPQTPADILKAIGEALSCGAENFENL